MEFTQKEVRNMTWADQDYNLRVTVYQQSGEYNVHINELSRGYSEEDTFHKVVAGGMKVKRDAMGMAEKLKQWMHDNGMNNAKVEYVKL